jgi:hypothetical protein
MHATLAPAVQHSYAVQVHKFRHNKIHNGLKVADLDFTDPNSKLFTITECVYSIGNIPNRENPTPCIIQNARSNPDIDFTAIGDSGGFQIGKERIKDSPQNTESTFNWLVNNADLLMPVDIPTVPMYEKRYTIPEFQTFDGCLMASVRNLSHFDKLGSKNHEFFTIVQGRGKDADEWFDFVKHFHWNHWAIADTHALTIREILWRIFVFIQHGYFNRKRLRIHFLGIGDLKTAVILTTIQDVLRLRFPKCHTDISFDTSTAFLLAGRFISVYKKPILGAKHLVLESEKINKIEWADNPEPFPFQCSRVSKGLTKGDIVALEKGVPVITKYGYLIIQNHNLDVQLTTYDLINQLFKTIKDKEHLRQFVPTYLIESVELIKRILSAPFQGSQTTNTALDIFCQAKSVKTLEKSRNNIRRVNSSRAKVLKPVPTVTATSNVLPFNKK